MPFPRFSLIQVTLEPEREEYRNVGLVVQESDGPPVILLTEGAVRRGVYEWMGASKAEQGNLDQEVAAFRLELERLLSQITFWSLQKVWGADSLPRVRLGPSHALRSRPADKWAAELFARLVLPP